MKEGGWGRGTPWLNSRLPFRHLHCLSRAEIWPLSPLCLKLLGTFKLGPKNFNQVLFEAMSGVNKKAKKSKVSGVDFREFQNCLAGRIRLVSQILSVGLPKLFLREKGHLFHYCLPFKFLSVLIQGDFFNWASPEFAKCWPVSD